MLPSGISTVFFIWNSGFLKFTGNYFEQLVSLVMIETFIFFAAFLLIGVLGYSYGRKSNSRKLSRVILRQRSGQFLGGILKNESERIALSKAYLNPSLALQELDSYPWDHLSIPTPFVGYAPGPSSDPRLAINSYQFRSKKDVAIPKPKQTLRLFLVGGSTAFGSGAPDPDSTIGGYLEGFLQEKYKISRCTVELFTFADTAWASTHERIAIESRISELEPDIIIALSGYNEAHWAWNQKDVMWFRSYSDGFYYDLIQRSFGVAGTEYPDDPLKSEPSVSDVNKVTNSLIKNARLAMLSLPHTASYIFALQPFIIESGKKLSTRELAILDHWHPLQKKYYSDCYAHFREALNNQFQGNNFAFFDLSGVFESCDAHEEIFLDSAHFGDRGNRHIAHAIEKKLAPVIQQKLAKYIKTT